MQLKFVTLDVFTSKPFSGNPLAVVFLPSTTPLTQRQKHIITLEFNLSETIFVYPVQDPTKRTIDIFTLECEIPFAGHPTIGAASWFLRLSGDVGVTSLITKSGEIPIRVSGDSGSGAGAVAAQIAHNTRIHAKRFPLADLLYLHPTLKTYFPEPSTSFPLFSIVHGMSQTFIELPSLEALGAVTRATGGDLVSAETDQYLDGGWQSGLICVYFFVRGVTDTDTNGQTVIRTRMILGSLEDPATGSAASGLASYLALTEGSAGEECRYHFVQGVEMGRRSDIGVQVVLGAERNIEEVVLTGTAVQVSEGTISVPEA